MKTIKDTRCFPRILPNTAISGFAVAGLTAVLAGSLTLGGCHQATHPDEKAAVNDSLKNNNLSSISVSQDRDKGVITLSGNVDSDSTKTQAETLARQSAPDYTIADEIGGAPAAGSAGRRGRQRSGLRD